MAKKLYDFHVTLRYRREGSHAATLRAPTREEAIRLGKADAMATSGGEIEGWRTTGCDQLAGPALPRAA